MSSATGGFVPGEFEKQSALVLGCNELVDIYPPAMVDIFKALIECVPLVAIVNSERQRHDAIALLADWGLPTHMVQFVALPVKSMWIRDYGPSFVRDAKGQITILDAEYVEADRRGDDLVPTFLADLLRVPVIHIPLLIEGGNLLSNGMGHAVTSTALFGRNAARGRDAQQVYSALSTRYGFVQCTTLNPLVTEPSGHVDLFMTFTAPDCVVIGQYDPAIDPINAKILDQNAALLSAIVTPRGPMKVFRVPMPNNHGGIWRTFTNVIFGNGTLLMPRYAGIDPKLEETARSVYQKLLPAWKIVAIETTEMILHRGSLHCASINIPWLDDRFVPPGVSGHAMKRNMELVGPIPYV